MCVRARGLVGGSSVLVRFFVGARWCARARELKSDYKSVSANVLVQVPCLLPTANELITRSDEKVSSRRCCLEHAFIIVSAIQAANSYSLQQRNGIGGT